MENSQREEGGGEAWSEHHSDSPHTAPLKSDGDVEAEEEIREEQEDSMSDSPHTAPLKSDGDVEAEEEIREEQEESISDEQMTADQEQSERHEEDQGDLEVDETEGFRKSLGRSLKAVKRFFKGSGDQKIADDPESTFQSETPPPQASTEFVFADADVYDFTHEKRGRAIIINNEKFSSHSGFDSRPGSKSDEDSLKDLFKHLGFDVKCYNDLTAIEMKVALEKEAHVYDHHKADCLAVAILSHGDSEILEKAWAYTQHKARMHDDKVRRDLIFGVDGSYISTASIICTFQDHRCPGLQGKPRLFFLQACRGGHYDDGVEVHVVRDRVVPPDDDSHDYAGEIEETDRKGFHLHHRRHVISPAPIFKDFLVMYATTPGYFAWRRSSGTWFIQSLYNVFKKQLTRHMPLTQALTRVIRMVAHGYQSQGNKANMSGKKQTPVLESMLTKDVYFTRK